jgi:hypothetical protein
LWKIHNAYDGFVADHPSQAVQEAFIRSVETLPPLKKSDRDEPILDSIFRAVFIAHKLVLRDELLVSNHHTSQPFCFVANSKRRMRRVQN